MLGRDRKSKVMKPQEQVVQDGDLEASGEGQRLRQKGWGPENLVFFLHGSQVEGWRDSGVLASQDRSKPSTKQLREVQGKPPCVLGK